MNAQLKKAIDKGEYNKNAYYDLITHNCSDIVIQALIHGGGAKFFPSLAGWGIVTPDYVDKAGTNIMLGIAKKMEMSVDDEKALAAAIEDFKKNGTY